jgi:aryl-alcohol dehydrogenase-like predicted oxidoreductase
MYNLVKRQAEVEILPMAAAQNLGVMVYNPIGGGLLAGKYGKDHTDGKGRFTTDDMYQKRYREEWVFDAAKRFYEFAKDQGYHPVSLAVAWVCHNKGVTTPIIGARNAAQLEDSLRSVEIEMTDQLYSAISDLTPTPPLATDRLEEQL